MEQGYTPKGIRATTHRYRPVHTSHGAFKCHEYFCTLASAQVSLLQNDKSIEAQLCFLQRGILGQLWPFGTTLGCPSSLIGAHCASVVYISLHLLSFAAPSIRPAHLHLSRKADTARCARCASVKGPVCSEGHGRDAHAGGGRALPGPGHRLKSAREEALGGALLRYHPLFAQLAPALHQVC